MGALDAFSTLPRKQMTFWEPGETLQVPDAARLGTFQDCLKAPVHRWFKYPAGFSYKLVEAFIDELGLIGHHWILDPFAGCGTVNVVAKQRGVNAIGIEAHPFVHWVATVIGIVQSSPFVGGAKSGERIPSGIMSRCKRSS